MEDKEIEQLLKSSAEKIQMKDFSERWEEISDRIQVPREDKSEVAVEEKVLVTSINDNIHNATRKKFIYSLCGLFLVIALCLAIVLPITLRTPSEPGYFTDEVLSGRFVPKNEFYSEIEKLSSDIASFSSIEFDMYNLRYTPANDLIGGALELLDEEEGVYLSIYCYKDNVIYHYDIGNDDKNYVTNGFNINYSTQFEDGFYSYKAKANKGKINYYFDYVAADGDIEGFFDKIFS